MEKRDEAQRIDVMKYFGCILMLLFTCVAFAEAPLFTWANDDLNNITFGAQCGNTASMKRSTEIKTPDGKSTVEVSLDQFVLDSKSECIQLNYIYNGGLKSGRKYEVTFSFRGSAAGAMLLSARQSGSPWEILKGSEGRVLVSKEWQTVKMIFTAQRDWNEKVRAPGIMLGKYESIPAKLYFGPVTLSEVADPSVPDGVTVAKQAVEMKENLIFNSSFELGDAGFNFIKQLYPPTNPKMIYEGAEIDTSTFVSGKQSLRMPNRFADEARLYPVEFSLQPRMEYTFSVWLKSDKPNTPVGLNFLSATALAQSWATRSCSFVAGTEWKRFSYTCVTESNAAFDPYILWISFGQGTNAIPATVWIDDMQLDQGKEKPYEAGSEIEAICIPIESIIVSKDGNAKVKNKIRVINNSRNSQKANVTVAASDDYSGRIEFSKNIGLPLAAGEMKEIDLDVAVNAFGSYLIDVKTGDDGIKFRSQPNGFGVIGTYERKPIDLDKIFCVGFNGPTVHFFGRPFMTKPDGFRAFGYGQDEYPERLGLMGCRLLRDWTQFPSPFSWQIIEREEGNYDFRLADRYIELFSRHGIQLLPVLEPFLDHGDVGPTYVTPEPEWMRLMRKNGKKVTFVSDFGEKTTLSLIPMEKWRAFVSAVVTHFKGKLSHYEIFNEPNLACPSASIYMEYLSAAFEEIRKADSNANVVGFCSTGDKGGNVEKFLEECFALNGLKKADIVSWHPYFARELASKTPADKQIADIRALTAKYNRPDIPLWNTEVFWIFGAQGPETPPYKAHHAARRFLTDLGEGVAQSMPVEEYTVWKDLITPKFKKDGGVFKAWHLLPNANYVGYNALARFFEGAKPIGKYRWDESGVCYAFERNGELLAAFWNFAGQGGFQAKLPGNVGDVQLYDLFGNKMDFDGSNLKIIDAPCYLKWKGGTADSVRAMLQKAVIIGERPFRVERALLINEGRTALLSVRNISGKVLDNAQVSIFDSAVKNDTGKFATAELKEIEIPVPSDVKPEAQGKMRVALYGAEKLFSDIVAANTVNFLMADGDKSPDMPIVKPVIGKPESADDLSAAFNISYDANNLILIVNVRDDKRSQSAKQRSPRKISVF